MNNCILCGRDFAASAACDECNGYRMTDLERLLKMARRSRSFVTSRTDGDGSTRVQIREGTFHFGPDGRLRH